VSLGSSIEWTNASWNPITGCTKVSAGCKNCYAERFAERFRGVPNHPFNQGFDLRFWPQRLAMPLSWKKPMKIFVNSMSDLFHEDVPFSYIERMFKTMEEANWHQFQILTKRSKRLSKLASRITWPDNVWVGVSVENHEVMYRIEDLRSIPAKIRFLSCEPLLGPLHELDLDGLGWVIVGGESGPGSRPMKPDWVRDIKKKCGKAGIPFFFKQWGGTRKHKAGRLLDGRTWDEMPNLGD
jgi:protein gp37